MEREPACEEEEEREEEEEVEEKEGEEEEEEELEEEMEEQEEEEEEGEEEMEEEEEEKAEDQGEEEQENGVEYGKEPTALKPTASTEAEQENLLGWASLVSEQGNTSAFAGPMASSASGASISTTLKPVAEASTTPQPTTSTKEGEDGPDREETPTEDEGTRMGLEPALEASTTSTTFQPTTSTKEGTGGEERKAAEGPRPRRLWQRPPHLRTSAYYQHQGGRGGD